MQHKYVEIVWMQEVRTMGNLDELLLRTGLLVLVWMVLTTVRVCSTERVSHGHEMLTHLSRLYAFRISCSEADLDTRRGRVSQRHARPARCAP